MTINDARKIVENYESSTTKNSEDDFFTDAFIDDDKLTTVYDELYGFEVLE